MLRVSLCVSDVNVGQRASVRSFDHRRSVRRTAAVRWSLCLIVFPSPRCFDLPPDTGLFSFIKLMFCPCVFLLFLLGSRDCRSGAGILVAQRSLRSLAHSLSRSVRCLIKNLPFGSPVAALLLALCDGDPRRRSLCRSFRTPKPDKQTL